jgi:hypothetical protein
VRSLRAAGVKATARIAEVKAGEPAWVSVG